MSRSDEFVCPQGQSCAVSLTYDDGLPSASEVFSLVSRLLPGLSYDD